VIQNLLWFAALGLAALLVSCGKPASDAQGGAPSGHPASQSGAAFSAPFDVVTASGVEMVSLPGGEFVMGSAKGEPDEAPPHKVRITAFLMDKFEVTHEMFTKAQLPNPSRWQDNPRKPVERIRWRDAKQYCNERSLLEKLKPCYDEKTADFDCDFNANGYRLPTEAEWEYACRAGVDGPYDFGSPDQVRLFAWFADNAGERTHVVGEKKANRWGVFDLYGNVSEWCEDVYSPTYYGQSPSLDPLGPLNPGKDVKRVMRGGSWKASADMCRATRRQGERTGDSDACFFTDYCGFRCVRRATPDEVRALMANRK
jgi:formylglycine-generating enzyme required for sulfatase activity